MIADALCVRVHASSRPPSLPRVTTAVAPSGRALRYESRRLPGLRDGPWRPRSRQEDRTRPVGAGRGARDPWGATAQRAPPAWVGSKGHRGCLIGDPSAAFRGIDPWHVSGRPTLSSMSLLVRRTAASRALRRTPRGPTLLLSEACPRLDAGSCCAASRSNGVDDDGFVREHLVYWDMEASSHRSGSYRRSVDTVSTDEAPR